MLRECGWAWWWAVSSVSTRPQCQAVWIEDTLLESLSPGHKRTGASCLAGNDVGFRRAAAELASGPEEGE